jgi:hypothetical protein
MLKHIGLANQTLLCIFSIFDVMAHLLACKPLIIHIFVHGFTLYYLLLMVHEQAQII